MSTGAAGAFPYLTTLVLLPAGAAVVTALLPRRSAFLARLVGIVGSVGALGVAIAVAVVFRSGAGGFQMVTDHRFIGAFGVSFALGVDGISLFLVLLCVLLFPLALLGTFERSGEKSFVFWVLLLETGCLGSFLSLDLLFFFIFNEYRLPRAHYRHSAKSESSHSCR